MRHILVVDDEKSIRTTLKLMLEREGHMVDIAESAKIALDLIEQREYDLIVTDIIMPKMTGMEMLESIKIITADTPVVIMTGEPTVDTATQAVKLGAFDYISKPVSKTTLLKVVDQAIYVRELLEEKKRLEEENQAYQKNLESMVVKRTKALEKTAQSTIEVMNHMMELRDPYTTIHQRQVGNLAAAIAREMGLTEHIVDGVRVTGYIHDIGKISVPLEILIKPSKLTPLQFELVKEHAGSGNLLLQCLELPWPVADIVWQHHERMDGSGYPRGLTGEQILIEAKILAVADVVEAMASHRPYRASLGLTNALKEIEDKRGRHFDEGAAQACLTLFRTKGYHIDSRFINTQFSFS